VAFHTALYRLSGNRAIEDTVAAQWPHFKRSMGAVLDDPEQRPPSIRSAARQVSISGITRVTLYTSGLERFNTNNRQGGSKMAPILTAEVPGILPSGSIGGRYRKGVEHEGKVELGGFGLERLECRVVERRASWSVHHHPPPIARRTAALMARSLSAVRAGLAVRGSCGTAAGAWRAARAGRAPRRRAPRSGIPPPSAGNG
jgi:hypothetical protein